MPTALRGERVAFFPKGLKPVATKCFEPTALVNTPQLNNKKRVAGFQTSSERGRPVNHFLPAIHPYGTRAQ